MKSLKKYLLSFFLLFILIFSLSSCGNKSSSNYGNGDSNNNVVGDTSRKIIYRAFYKIKTDDYKILQSEINEKTIELNGYIYESNETNDSAYYVYKIPTEKLNEFLNYIDKEGNVTSKNISSEDVTTKYNELQAKIDTLTLRKEAYIKFIEDNPDMNLTEKLSIYDKVDEIDEKLKTLSYEQATMNSSIDYATVTIDYSNANESSYFAKYGNFLLNLLKIIGTILLVSLPFVFIALIVCFVIYIINKKTKNIEK